MTTPTDPPQFDPRLAFSEGAIKGALAMFSPWAPDPSGAQQAFALASKAAFEAGLLNPRQARTTHSVAALAVAEKASSFDLELALSPLPKATVNAWRAAFADAFEAACGPMADKRRLVAASDGPKWLVEALIARRKLDPIEAFATAQAILALHRQQKLGHAAACLPPEYHMFSTVSEMRSSLARQAFSETELNHARTASQTSFATISHRSDSRDGAFAQDISARFWDSPDAKHATLDAFSRLDKKPFDAFTASLVLCCADGPVMISDCSSWIESVGRLPITDKQAFFLLWASPDRGLAVATRVVDSAVTPTIEMLQVVLARLVYLDSTQRVGVLPLLLHWTLAAAQRAPEQLAALTARARKNASSAKTLGSNVFELALRIAVRGRSSSRPEEAELLRSIMRAASGTGFDPARPDPASGLSTRDKLAQLKNSEAKIWSSWLEALDLERSVSPVAPCSVRAPRL